MPFDGTNYDTPVTNPVTELLEEAWSLIDKPQKWCRGQVRSADGRRLCSVGALAAVADPSFFDAWVANTDLNKAVGFLHQAMGLQIPTFNDTHRHVEISAAWQRAIALSRCLERDSRTQP